MKNNCNQDNWNISEFDEDLISRLSSLVSDRENLLKLNQQEVKLSDGEKWNDDDNNSDLNKLLDEFVKQKSSFPRNREPENCLFDKFGILIEHFDEGQEETKDHISVADSINDELDQMLLDNSINHISQSGHQNKKSQVNNMDRMEDSSFLVAAKSNLIRKESNNSDLERLASMILQENSRNKAVVGTKSQFESKSKKDDYEEKEVSLDEDDSDDEFSCHYIYRKNISEQPAEKTLALRKNANQYAPFGVFTKMNGGLCKYNSQCFVRANLLFYSKYDKRLTAEIIKYETASLSNENMQKGKLVIVVGNTHSKILVCPINEDVEQK
jgi:hypothetical protein